MSDYHFQRMYTPDDAAKSPEIVGESNNEWRMVHGRNGERIRMYWRIPSVEVVEAVYRDALEIGELCEQLVPLGFATEWAQGLNHSHSVFDGFKNSEAFRPHQGPSRPAVTKKADQQFCEIKSSYTTMFVDMIKKVKESVRTEGGRTALDEIIGNNSTALSAKWQNATQFDLHVMFQEFNVWLLLLNSALKLDKEQYNFSLERTRYEQLLQCNEQRQLQQIERHKRAQAAAQASAQARQPEPKPQKKESTFRRIFSSHSLGEHILDEGDAAISRRAAERYQL